MKFQTEIQWIGESPNNHRFKTSTNPDGCIDSPVSGGYFEGRLMSKPTQEDLKTITQPGEQPC